ncbi:hypothetical protein RIF29_34943 [Crotalaria pallida]|uniref:Uncharacterized protein n=1 Tax=Crotalaria pallida TaxID=3830 RepID=A0AAN9HRG7_CROPI
MAKKKGRPPKSPSPHNSSPPPSIPKNLDLEQLDDDDFEDIDNLSPKKAASILKKLDMLRSKIKGKAVVQYDETERDVQPESGGKEEEASNKRVDWPDVQAEFGNCGVSDHSPMVIHWPNSERCKGQTFKFLNHLTLDDEFIQIVNQNWSSRREGCAMFRIMRNLEHLKGGLKDLNQRKFKSIDVKEIQARDRLDYIQNLLQSDPMNNHLLKLEKEAKEEHLKVEENFS